MPDSTKPADNDEQPDASNQGQSATKPAEGGDGTPGGNDGSPERE